MTAEFVKRAIKESNLEILDADNLRDLDIDLNEGLGADGYNALHWSCYYSKCEVLEHLLGIGSDVSVTTAQGWTGAHVCAIKGSTMCFQVLTKSSIDLATPDNRGYTCAHLAAAHGKRGILQGIVDSGGSVSACDRRGWNVAHHSAFHGRIATLQMVSQLVVDLSADDKQGNTPAHLAAAEGHLDCLKLLVQQHDRPLDVLSFRNDDGATPKDLAVKFQKMDCVDFLSSIEADGGKGRFSGELRLEDEVPHHSTASSDSVFVPPSTTTDSADEVYTRIQELEQLLMSAKAQYKLLGGMKLDDTNEENTTHKEVAELRAQLVSEQEQRERLEQELEKAKEQLQHATDRLHKYQELTFNDRAISGEPRADRTRTANRKQSSSRHQRRSTGGAFIRIGHM